MTWGHLKETFDKYTGLATALSTGIGALAFAFTGYQMYSESNDRAQQRYNTAWMLVSTASISGENAVDGGRREALIYLRDGKKSLQGAQLSKAILSHIILDGADLNRSDMEYADLFGANLRAVSLWGADMRNANLQFAQLQGADLGDADLTCADLRGARLERLELKEYLRDKVRGKIFRIKDIEGRVNNEMIFGYLKEKSALYGEKLRLDTLQPVYTNLHNAQLERAHLEGADLRGANLRGANLKYAHLGKYKDKFEPYKDKSDPDKSCRRESNGLRWLRVDSREEICKWTQDRHIELPESFFCEDSPNKPAAEVPAADLTGVDLTGVDLTGADLTDAVGITAEQIKAAAHLCNTILPDSTKSYRDCPEHAQQ